MTDRQIFYKKIVYLLFALILIAGVFVYLLLVPAPDFPIGEVFTIRQGEGLKEIATNLHERGFIRSSSLFQLSVSFWGKSKNLQAGDYYFEAPVSLYEIAKRVSRGDFGIKIFKITIPEGSNLKQIADIFEGAGLYNKQKIFELTGLPAVIDKNPTVLSSGDFSEKSPLVSKKPKSLSLEGYLFPDTYFFTEYTSLPKALERMIRNLEDKVTPEIRSEIARKGKTVHEILTMASLVEEEATKDTDRKMIAGILWKRLAIGMPLQVDPTVRYSTGKYNGGIPAEDFKIDSAFNTYKYAGLPPGPISNPGIEAIRATLEPIESPYFFYMSDAHDNTYYAVTFEEHKENKRKYLNK